MNFCLLCRYIGVCSFGRCPFLGVIVDSLFIVAPDVCGPLMFVDVWSLFCSFFSKAAVPLFIHCLLLLPIVFLYIVLVSSSREI